MIMHGQECVYMFVSCFYKHPCMHGYTHGCICLSMQAHTHTPIHVTWTHTHTLSLSVCLPPPPPPPPPPFVWLHIVPVYSFSHDEGWLLEPSISLFISKSDAYFYKPQMLLIHIFSMTFFTFYTIFKQQTFGSQMKSIADLTRHCWCCYITDLIWF